MACYDSPWCIIHVCPNLGGSLSLPSAFSWATEWFCYPRGDILAVIRIVSTLTREPWDRLTSLSPIQMAPICMLETDVVLCVCSAALMLSNMYLPWFLWGMSGGTLLCIVMWLCKWHPCGMYVCIRLSVLACADGWWYPLCMYVYMVLSANKCYLKTSNQPKPTIVKCLK